MGTTIAMSDLAGSSDKVEPSVDPAVFKRATERKGRVTSHLTRDQLLPMVLHLNQLLTHRYGIQPAKPETKVFLYDAYTLPDGERYHVLYLPPSSRGVDYLTICLQYLWFERYEDQGLVPLEAIRQLTERFVDQYSAAFRACGFGEIAWEATA